MKRKSQPQSILPTESIQVGNHKLNLNNELQLSPQGHELKYVGLKTENNIWVYMFKYTKDNNMLNLPFLNGLFQKKLYEQYNTSNK